MDTISIRLNYAQETLGELLDALEALMQAAKAITEPIFPASTSPEDCAQETSKVLGEVAELRELIEGLAVDIMVARQAHCEEMLAVRGCRPETQGRPLHGNAALINDIGGSVAWTLGAQGCAQAIRRGLAKGATLRRREVKFLLRQALSLFASYDSISINSIHPVENLEGAVPVEASQDFHALSAA